MSSEVAVAGEQSTSSFDASLEAERAVERELMRSVIRAIVFGVPIGIAVSLGLLALAISDKADWFVWVGLGVGGGVVGALLFGVLAGVTLAAHKLDVVDQQFGHS
jgi:Mg/Co/Ni transporter MgtE